jgi:hypothetical protein
MNNKPLINFVEVVKPSSEIVGLGLLTIGMFIGGIGIYIIALKVSSYK